MYETSICVIYLFIYFFLSILFIYWNCLSLTSRFNRFKGYINEDSSKNTTTMPDIESWRWCEIISIKRSISLDLYFRVLYNITITIPTTQFNIMKINMRYLNIYNIIPVVNSFELRIMCALPRLREIRWRSLGWQLS